MHGTTARMRQTSRPDGARLVSSDPGSCGRAAADLLPLCDAAFETAPMHRRQPCTPGLLPGERVHRGRKCCSQCPGSRRVRGQCVSIAAMPCDAQAGVILLYHHSLPCPHPSIWPRTKVCQCTPSAASRRHHAPRRSSHTRRTRAAISACVLCIRAPRSSHTWRTRCTRSAISARASRPDAQGREMALYAPTP